MTTARCHLVSTEQVIPDVVHQIVTSDYQVTLNSVAMVPLEWGGVTGSLKVAVSPVVSVDCLLGNDLEHTIWKEVELRSQAEMVLPEC